MSPRTNEKLKSDASKFPENLHDVFSPTTLLYLNYYFKKVTFQTLLTSQVLLLP